MTRTSAVAAFCVGSLCPDGTGSTRADDPAAKELKRFEGVWASAPAKKGRGRAHILVFKGGRMVWRSFQTMDGEPVIGHAKLYEPRLDPKASPQQLTATRGEHDDRENRGAIYAVDGDALKVALGSGPDGGRPTMFTDESAQVITLARGKKAKFPDLPKAGTRGKENRVGPAKKWAGRVRDAVVANQCPKEPITDRTGIEKVWKALRGRARCRRWTSPTSSSWSGRPPPGR